MALLLTCTIFTNALLIFLMEPMIGKVLLPRFGGTPQVWGSCMFFFQVALLCGYGYAHYLSKYSSKKLLVIHFSLSILALWPYTTALSSLPEFSAEQSPLLAIFKWLTFTIGPLFALLSANSTIIQSWAAQASFKNPYQLYAASNLGSLLGLLAYPLFFERYYNISEQWQVLAWGLLALLLILIVFTTIQKTSLTKEPISASSKPPLTTCLTWLMLSALPSGLLLATTAHITSDIAPIPLLWVIPLSLYLLVFALVFTPLNEKILPIVQRYGPLLFLGLIPFIYYPSPSSAIFNLTSMLLLFTLLCLGCLGELSAKKPAVAQLSFYYLIISLGGVIGAFFVSLLSPVIFIRYLEFPLLIAASAFALVRLSPKPFLAGRTLLFIAFMLIGILLSSQLRTIYNNLDFIFCYGLPSIFILSVRTYRYSFAIGAFALIFALDHIEQHDSTRILQIRNFFGSKEVREDKEEGLRALMHGKTIHGAQNLMHEEIPEPLTYYARSGPLKDAMASVSNVPGRVGVLGLGIGSIACYSKDNEVMDFFEIDPQVVEIAKNPKFFTFLSTCQPQGNMYVGDGRKVLETIQANSYRLLQIDAFSSDAIPMHLLTLEAIKTYLNTLSPEGILLFHISNRYVSLSPQLTRQAKALGLELLLKEYFPTEDEQKRNAFQSHYVVMTKNSTVIRTLLLNGWHLKRPSEGAIWTDDYHNLAKLFFQ